MMTGCCARVDGRTDPADEVKGYVVRSGDDPADIPVVIRSEGSEFRAWLREDGTFSFTEPG
jgi:hypothetical protein